MVALYWLASWQGRQSGAGSTEQHAESARLHVASMSLCVSEHAAPAESSQSDRRHCCTQVVSAVLDWAAVQHPVLPGYDVIMGADLMYIKEAAPQLASVIPHLCSPAAERLGSPAERQDTLLLMADPETRTPQNR